MKPARRCGLAVVLVLAAGAASPARAAQDEAPRWGMELRMGPFRPRISSDPLDRQYYALVYAGNNDRSLFKNEPLLKIVEASRYYVRSFGLLGVSASVGHWRVTGNSRVCYDPANPQVQVGCTPTTVWQSSPGNDTTDLTIVPLAAGLVYRFDLLNRTRNIPLVPYGKLGLDYALWWNTAGGKLSTSATTKGKGGTLGYVASIGMMLSLDWIEPSTSSRARATSGIADSYLYVDWTRRVSDGFGSSTRLGTSGDVVSVGLALDML